MAKQTDSSTVGADGSDLENIFQLPAVIVSAKDTGATFSDVIGSNNIFNYGTGTITAGPANVAIGDSSLKIPQNYASDVIGAQPVKGVGDVIFDEELARQQALRAAQNKPALTSSEIGDIADWAVKQVDVVYDDAQRALDQSQAARQIGQAGSVVPIPLPVSNQAAAIINAIQLIGMLGNVTANTNLSGETPATPQETIEKGGSLSDIGTGATTPTTATGVTQTNNPITGLINAGAGIVGAASGIFTGPVAAPASSTDLGTTTPGATTSTVVVTPGATGGQTTGTGSSTPSTTNPNGTTTAQPSGIFVGPVSEQNTQQQQSASTTPISIDASTVNNEQGLSVLKQVMAGIGQTAPATTDQGIDQQTGLNVMNQVLSNVGKTTSATTTPIDSSTTATSTSTTTNTGTGTGTGTGTNVNNNQTDTSCPPGQVRINGVCQVPNVNPTTTTTTSTTDTKSQDQSACPPGQVRINGVCQVPPVNPTGTTGTTDTKSTDDTSCPPGQVRINGVCQVPNVNPTTTTTGGGGGGGGTAINPFVFNFPSSTYTPMPTNTAQRNIYTEGLTSGTAFTALTTTFSNMYGGLAQGYQAADLARLFGMADPTSQFGLAQQGFGQMANQQTQQANAALRAGNIGDVASLAGQAGTIFQTANPFLQQAQQALAAGGTTVNASPYEQQLANYFRMGPQFQTVAGVGPTAQDVSAAQIAAGAGGQISAGEGLNDRVLAAARLQALSGQGNPLEQQLALRAQQQLELGGDLSQEDIRNAQQSAREAYAARGQVMSQGAAAQEVLNRQALSQQRQAQREAFAQNVNQQLMAGQQMRNQYGLGVIGAGQAATAQDIQAQLANQAAGLEIAQRNQAALQQAALANQAAQLQAGTSSAQIGLQSQLANQAAQQQALGQNLGLGQQLSAANTALQQQNIANALQNVNLQRNVAFNPFDVILGQQYGMQTQNVGTTQGLFGQAGNLASGNLAYQPVIQTYNPFGVYPADVYGTNVNAVNAAQIAEANRLAALQAANLGQTGDYAKALGTFLGTPTGGNVLGGLAKLFGFGG